MWTIEEGDREYFYGAGVAHQSGYGYAPHPSYGYGHSHGYGGPHATTYSVDMPAMEPTVELSVDMHSDRSRKAIMRKLAKLKGVATVDVDLHRQKVTVTGNVTPAEVLKKVGRDKAVRDGRGCDGDDDASMGKAGWDLKPKPASGLELRQCGMQGCSEQVGRGPGAGQAVIVPPSCGLKGMRGTGGTDRG